MMFVMTNIINVTKAGGMAGPRATTRGPMASRRRLQMSGSARKGVTGQAASNPVHRMPRGGRSRQARPTPGLLPSKEGIRSMTWNESAEKEPTAAELAAIEAEWSLVEAELAVLDAQIRVLSATGGPSPLDWRRVRRARRQLLAARLQSASPHGGHVAGVA